MQSNTPSSSSAGDVSSQSSGQNSGRSGDPRPSAQESAQESAAFQMALANCAKEPIHIPGSVQAHGILIALRQSDFTILQISENVFDFVGIHSSELMHQPLSKLMNTSPVERASRRLGERLPRLLNPIPLEIEAHGKHIQFDGILHRSGRLLILELERHVRDANSIQEEQIQGSGFSGFGGFYESLREVVSNVTLAEDLVDIFEIATDELRRLTGFDRVAIYKFDEEWNGTVINESKVESATSILHHRFPASDIPKQARELYTTNWLRLIPNVNYKPSQMVPAENPITGKPLDMSNAVLRSVSPIHLQYMRNMGQDASMSISLLKGRQLWGLITCHNSKPLYLNYSTRVVCEFIGQMVSAQIVAREESNVEAHRTQLKSIYNDLLRKGMSFESVVHSLQSNASRLLALTESQGAALCFNGESVLVGATPGLEAVQKIRNWFAATNEPLLATENLSQVLPEASQWFSTCAGVLGISIPKGDSAIFWFRPEMIEEVAWSGNPNLSKTVSATGEISPRASFATWLEKVSGHSKKWAVAEVDVAEELRGALTGMALRSATHHETEDDRKEFRNSLANSLAASSLTENERQLAQLSAKQPKSFVEAAQNSRLLLEGFAEFAVLFLDLNGNIQNWSSSAMRLFGYAPESVLGKSIGMFFGEEELLREEHLAIIESVTEKGRFEEELWLYREDQSSFWGKIMVATVKDEKDGLIGFSIVIQDTTKDRAAEEELRATKLAAEAANVAKTAFLANISHEIRTPLGAVLGFSELLSQKNQSDEDRIELYGRIKRNGEQLNALINDLLDLTKVESGKLEIETIEFDLNDMLLDLQQTFIIKAAEKSLRFGISIRGAVPKYVVSDPTRLRQILVNLLSNAIKFTGHGGTVELECSMDRLFDSDKLAFRVKDTGRGMTEAEMGRLFQPFAQADVSTTRKFGGTGLGLFVSRRLARALSGDLTIETSKLDHGTVFLARVDAGAPRVTDKITQVQARSESSSSSINEVDPRSLAGINILVVDDSADNRHLIQLYLKKSGAQSSTAEDGEQAVEKALQGKFDLVLMDIQMPVMDGNLAMRKLREKGYDKPVIALTAHAMNEERERSLNAGFSDYVTKPINRAALVRSILNLTHK